MGVRSWGDAGRFDAPGTPDTARRGSTSRWPPLPIGDRTGPPAIDHRVASMSDCGGRVALVRGYAAPQWLVPGCRDRRPPRRQRRLKPWPEPMAQACPVMRRARRCPARPRRARRERGARPSSFRRHHPPPHQRRAHPFAVGRSPDALQTHRTPEAAEIGHACRFTRHQSDRSVALLPGALQPLGPHAAIGECLR